MPAGADGGEMQRVRICLEVSEHSPSEQFQVTHFEQCQAPCEAEWIDIIPLSAQIPKKMELSLLGLANTLKL
jgi:hypothetical protein